MIAHTTVMLFAAVNILLGITCLLLSKEIRELWETIRRIQETMDNLIKPIMSMDKTLKNTKESLEMMFTLDQSTMQELEDLQKDFAHLVEISGQRIGNLENQVTMLKRRIEND